MKKKFSHSKEVFRFIDSIVQIASSNDEDRANVAVDIIMLVMKSLTESQLQDALNIISTEYKVTAPKIYLEEDDLPF